jgi:cbb3-type cytochrome oxidase subunit 3
VIRIPYLREAGLIVGLLLFVAWSAWLYRAGGRAELAKCQAAQLKAVEAANKRAEKLQRTLDALPKAEESIREVVRENPSRCERPVPVANRLREAIREANAARKVPGNP